MGLTAWGSCGRERRCAKREASLRAGVVAKLEDEDGEGQGQCDGVGSDDGRGADAEAVDQPGGHFKTEQKKCRQRDVAGALATPHADQLRQEGGGGASSADGTEDVYDHRREKAEGMHFIDCSKRTRLPWKSQ